MSLNDCFIVLKVSSRKGLFLLAEKKKYKNNVSRGPFTNHSCSWVCKIDSDTDSDHSAFASDLDELKS